MPFSLNSGRSACRNSERGPDSPPRHIGSPALTTSSLGGSAPNARFIWGRARFANAITSLRRMCSPLGPPTLNSQPSIELAPRADGARDHPAHRPVEAAARVDHDEFALVAREPVRRVDVGPALRQREAQPRARVGAARGADRERRHEVVAAHDRPARRDPRVVAAAAPLVVDLVAVVQGAAGPRAAPR